MKLGPSDVVDVPVRTSRGFFENTLSGIDTIGSPVLTSGGVLRVIIFAGPVIADLVGYHGSERPDPTMAASSADLTTFASRAASTIDVLVPALAQESPELRDLVVSRAMAPMQLG